MYGSGGQYPLRLRGAAKRPVPRDSPCPKIGTKRLIGRKDSCNVTRMRMPSNPTRKRIKITSLTFRADYIGLPFDVAAKISIGFQRLKWRCNDAIDRIAKHVKESQSAEAPADQYSWVFRAA